MKQQRYSMPLNPVLQRTGPAANSAGPAWRLVSPRSRPAAGVPSHSCVMPQGPRRSPWSQPPSTPEKVSASPRRPGQPRLQWSDRSETSKSPRILKATGTAGTVSTGALSTKRDKGKTNRAEGMRSASAETISCDRGEEKPPWPILLGSRQGSFGSFHDSLPDKCETSQASQGPRKADGWIVKQCQDVMELVDPFRSCLETVLSDPHADLQHLKSRCKLMVAATSALQQALDGHNVDTRSHHDVAGSSCSDTNARSSALEVVRAEVEDLKQQVNVLERGVKADDLEQVAGQLRKRVAELQEEKARAAASQEECRELRLQIAELVAQTTSPGLGLQQCLGLRERLEKLKKEMQTDQPNQLQNELTMKNV